MTSITINTGISTGPWSAGIGRSMASRTSNGCSHPGNQARPFGFEFNCPVSPDHRRRRCRLHLHGYGALRFHADKRAITGFRAGRLQFARRRTPTTYRRVLDIRCGRYRHAHGRFRRGSGHIVQCMKYPPMGQRGVALNIAHGRYVPGDTKKGLADANRRNGFAPIRTRPVSATSTPSPQQRARLPLDGHLTSCSLGIPGEFIIRLQEGIGVKRAARKQQGIGPLGRTPAETIALQRGYDLLCWNPATLGCMADRRDRRTA